MKAYWKKYAFREWKALSLEGASTYPRGPGPWATYRRVPRSQGRGRAVVVFFLAAPPRETEETEEGASCRRRGGLLRPSRGHRRVRLSLPHPSPQRGSDGTAGSDGGEWRQRGAEAGGRW